MSKLKTSIGTNYAIPGAIIIVGLLIAGTIVFSGNSSSGTQVASHNSGNRIATSEPPQSFRLPNEDDHLLGNPDAEITIIEFSDFECPFCARLHPTLATLVESRDDVNWVYRHFPLSSHSNAFGAAVASECAASLAGNEAFWAYGDALFENHRQLGPDIYTGIAASLGINGSEFESCLSSEDIRREVQADFAEIRNLGGSGTPYGIVVTARGKLIPFSGALDINTLNSIVDAAKQS